MNNREAFEAWFGSEMPMESLITNQDNDYKYQPAIASWESWQAALASQKDHIPDVGKMVQSQAQQEPSKDIHEAITLLSAVFDAWENGTDCYDDFDGVSGSFIGKAFNLDDEIFKRCCDLLNRVNPPRNVSQAQQTESQWISVEERLPEGYKPVLVVTNFGDVYTCRLPVIIAKNSKEESSVGKRERFTHWMPLPKRPNED